MTEPGRLYRGGNVSRRDAENAEGAEGRGVLGMRAVEVGRLNHLSQPLREAKRRREKTRERKPR